jgi:DNA polymerase sigma
MHQPTLKPIVLVLKKLLLAQNLNQPYLGGLNSYSLVIMTYAFLQMFGTTSTSKNL